MSISHANRSPQQLAELVAELVSTRTHFTEDEIHDAVVATGVPSPEAYRAYWLVQLAWSRFCLVSLGAKFPLDEFFCINEHGKVVSEGRCGSDPLYAAAVALIPTYSNSLGFRWLAGTSADAVVVRDAVRDGRKPTDQVCGPSYRVLARLTPAGEKEFMRLQNEHLARLSMVASVGRPSLWGHIANWWRQRQFLKALRKKSD